MTQYEVDRYIQQMIEIEDEIYHFIESQWTTLENISQHLTQAGLYLNDRLLDGSQADQIVKDICLGFYRKVQKHYKDPNFREMLNPIEKEFPDRSKFQIAVVKDVHNPTRWIIRKRIFKRLPDQVPRHNK